VGTERPTEETSCCPEIASSGREYVDDLDVLVDGPVAVAPFAGDFDVGLGEEWHEALDPPVDG
jgi:hypothetical protein